MAVAKNLARHGTFGVSPHRFSSSTSSPLWAVLLFLIYKTVGISDCAPGILAAVFALAALYTANALCLAFQVTTLGRLIICLSLLHFTPLVTIVSTGMEHAMHVCFTLILLLATVKFVSGPTWKTAISMCIAGAFAVATRYESLFLVGPICIWLFNTKRRKEALLLLSVSAVPVILYGIFSTANGSYFLPNSLIMKGAFPSMHGIKRIVDTLGYRGFGRLTITHHIHVISVLLLVAFLLARKRGTYVAALALCVFGAIFLHMQFASTGSFYRYEAYLIALSLPILGALFQDFRDCLLPKTAHYHGWIARSAVFLCAVIFIWPLERRAKESLECIVPASQHIYNQQYQMSRFLRQMYSPGVRVALNDLGSIAYYADADILDLCGLGTIDVVTAKKKRMYTKQKIQDLFENHKTQIIMVYSNWFKGLLPDMLIPIAEWRTTDNVENSTVTFYAISDDLAEDAKHRLLRFQSNLPKSVEVRYFDTPSTN